MLNFLFWIFLEEICNSTPWFFVLPIFPISEFVPLMEGIVRLKSRSEVFDQYMSKVPRTLSFKNPKSKPVLTERVVSHPRFGDANLEG